MDATLHSSSPVIAESTTHLLHRAGQYAEELFSKSIGELGLTARQFAVLSAVDVSDNPSQTVLCEISGIDRSTLADIVRRLVARGLLSRRRTREDARMYAVRITPEGKKILEQAIPIARQVDHLLLKPLSPSERDAFGNGLQSIVSHNGDEANVASS